MKKPESNQEQRNKEIISSVKKIFSSPINEMAMNEMAQISGELKNAIDSVIKSNPDKSGLDLKKAIKADEAVKTALGDDTLHDNQLNRFIAVAKGELNLGQRGRKADPVKAIASSVIAKFSSGEAYTPEEIDFINKLSKSVKKSPAKKQEVPAEQLNESLTRMQKLAGINKN